MAKTVYYNQNSVMREIITDAHSSEVTMHTAQDVEPIIETVKELRDIHHHIGHRRSENLVPVAEIPLTVYEQAAREGWLHDKKKWREWLNDPQNKVFRITDGRV